MKTRAINSYRRFINIFTCQGRSSNAVYKKLNKNGMTYIRERELSDKSRVILGYENKASKTNAFAYKINPDNTAVQKSYEYNTVFNLFDDINKSITKLWLDSTGKVAERENINIRFRGAKMLGRMKYFLSKRLLKQSYEGSFTNIINSDRPLKKMYRKITTTNKNTDLYSVFEYSDGTKEYKKKVNGIEYFFRTLAK